MSRPRKVDSPQILEKYVNDFIKMCENDENINPSDYEFCKFCEISVSTLERMRKGGEREDDVYFGYDLPLKRLVYYREHRYTKMLVNKPNSATACIFLLKQPKNGGYTDANSVDFNGESKLTIKVDGIGGVEALK